MISTTFAKVILLKAKHVEYRKKTKGKKIKINPYVEKITGFYFSLE